MRRIARIRQRAYGLKNHLFPPLRLQNGLLISPRMTRRESSIQNPSAALVVLVLVGSASSLTRAWSALLARAQERETMYTPELNREFALARLVLPYLENPAVIEATRQMCRDSASIAAQIRRECAGIDEAD